jgi:uracil-DNA glycosylase
VLPVPRRLPTESEVPVQDVIRNLADYVEFEAAEGRAGLEVPPETARQLRNLSLPARPGPAAPPLKPCPPAPAAPSDSASAAARRALDDIATTIAACRRCALHQTRTRTVPGQGCPTTEILFVGEAPGADEDLQGLAFVGAAGQLLTRMIAAMGFAREQVFIANVLKCRPPGNRPPLPEEMETCLPYLRAQIAALKPKVIVTLGATAIRGLLGPTEGITKLRGTWLSFDGIAVMPTFHPSYLLRTPSAKRVVWDDLQAVMKRLGRTPPPSPRRGD